MSGSFDSGGEARASVLAQLAVLRELEPIALRQVAKYRFLLREIGRRKEALEGLLVAGELGVAEGAPRKVGRPSVVADGELLRIEELLSEGVPFRKVAQVITEERRDVDPRAVALSTSSVVRASQRLVPKSDAAGFVVGDGKED